MKMAENISDTEKQLITYLTNILKYQIIPMDYMNLRDLVKEAPKHMKLHEFVEERYPGTMFADFIKSHPNIFILNDNRTVILAEGNSFVFPSSEIRYPDVVDGCDGRDMAEYISDTDSDSEDSDKDQLQEKDLPSKVAEHLGIDSADSASSTVDVFSSEMVHTSDSNQSSFTSSSSADA